MNQQLQQLKTEIQQLEKLSKENLQRPHGNDSFEKQLEHVQRGKFIAYGHVISLIDNILNK